MKILTVTLLAISIAHVLCAEVAANSLFSDNAVLQRDCVMPIWGTAQDGEKITIEFAGQKVSTMAKDGLWEVKLKPLVAGGPFTMKVIGKNTITLTNILVGDVWVASGQSNMQRPLGNTWEGSPPVDDWQAEINAANYPQLRQFNVPLKIAYQPITDCQGNWTICSPQTAADFSAVGYFFGRDVQEVVHVPVGLLFSSWGGTVAEAWTSANSLKRMREFSTDLSSVHEIVTNYFDATKSYEKSRDAWYLHNDPGSSALPAWNDPDFNTTEWGQMNVPTQWDYVGIVWFRKEFDLPNSWSGKRAILHLGPIDDQDTTWVNGVCVGGMQHWYEDRNYSIAVGVLKPGRNVIMVRMLNTGGVGGIDGKSEQMRLEACDDKSSTPVSLAGTWRYKDSISLQKTQPFPIDYSSDPNVPTVLYNGMIAPLQPFPIKGVIWYQGEANNDRAQQYQTLFPLLIGDWREKWHLGNLPFLFVQIAPYREITPEIRDAQLLTFKKTRNTAMVVTTDAGDVGNIHPSHKQIVGKRLALAALALAYGKQIEYSGPLYESMRIKNNEAIISFSHVGKGLTAEGGIVKGFMIAGPDKKFIAAHAKINGDKIIVTSEQVSMPAAVRYGWANVPDVNLYNKDGFPASPFRTDE